MSFAYSKKFCSKFSLEDFYLDVDKYILPIVKYVKWYLP